MLVTLLVLVTGMVYSLLWTPLVRHHSVWVVPGDIWSTYRSAQFIGWGDLGGVYSAGTHLVTFPGILLALAPVAVLAGALGLGEAFPFAQPHPSAWLVLGPVEMLLSAIALFACDALAESLEVPARRRWALCIFEGVVLWNVSVVWGHPEDAVAVGLAVYALVLALQKRWTGAGWLFGAAVATQPLVILMLPVLLTMAGRQECIGFLLRSFAPVALLMTTPLVAQFHPTVQAILDQPNYPRIDHATPWTSLAPSLGGSGSDLAVAAGPGRLLAVALACGLGAWARRWRDRPTMLVWAAAAALSLRCFTESVMVSFYVWPALAIALVVAARAGRIRLTGAACLALFVTVLSNERLGTIPWWLFVTGGIGLVLGAGLTYSMSRRSPDVPMIVESASEVASLESASRELVRATP